MRRAAPFLLAAAVVAVVVIGLSQASDKSSSSGKLPRYDLQQALAKLNGAPAPLAALHEQHSALLTGGLEAFRRRLATLKGHPIVINKWAEWCNPCRQEFRLFQQAGTDYGKRVAFVGLDGPDNLDAARTFMREFPIPYPSYRDDGAKIARAFEIPAVFPVTKFIAADGKSIIHQGQYATYADLKADIKRYLRV